MLFVYRGCFPFKYNYIKGREETMGYAYAFAAVFLWSFNYIIAASFAKSLQPFEIAFGRWFLASLVLVPLAAKELVFRRGVLWRNRWLIIGLSLTGMFLCNTLIYYAGRTASPLNMSLLGMTGPVFIAVLSAMFLNGKINGVQIFGFLTALIGVAVVITAGRLSAIGNIPFVAGDWLMLLNAFCFAVYTILQSRRPKEISQRAMLAVTAVVGTIMIFPVACFENGGMPFENLSLKDMEVFLYLGIMNSVIAYLAWNTALDKIGSLQTGVIYYSLPLFSGTEAYFMMGEKVFPAQAWGGLLVIAGIFCVSFAGQLQKRMDLTVKK